MNSLYTSGVRQTNSLQADLERLRNGDTSASLIGQISASLSAMQRTIDDYDSMARREMIKAKQEKAQMRVQKFRVDYADIKNQFERLRAEATNAQQRNELFSTGASSTNPMSPMDARRRFSQQQQQQQQQLGHSESPFSNPRENYALREHTFIQETETRLDEFLAQGREALDNLIDQRNMLKGTQRRLLDTANTLGLSRDVIGWIERRSTQDMYIFFAGAVFTFFCFYLIWKYLG